MAIRQVINLEAFSVRLRKAMTLRNYKQVDLVEKTGLDKSLISNYLSGKYKAKQDNIYILAKALDVNEAWLMGFDTNIDRVPDKDRTQIMEYTATDDSMLPLLGIDDIAYIDPKDTYKSEETIYFKLDGKNMIRKIVDKGNIVEFHAMNPYYPVMQFTKEQLKEKQFIIIGKVIKVENKSAFK